MPRHQLPNESAVERLRGFIDGIDRLLDEIDALKDDVKELKASARGAGFDVGAIEALVKEKRESREKRAARLETEAIADVYRAALGMLGGTPLGEAARQRLAPPPPKPDDGQQEAPMEAPPVDVDAARVQGREACRAGKKVTDNPFVAGDPRRAAWDEGWCLEAGTDGMDIPAAWRRKKPEKEKPAEPDPTPPEEPEGNPDDGEEG